MTFSRNADIIENILGADHELEDPQSRVEAILQAILYNDEYTDEAESRVETILLCILNGETCDLEPQCENEEILIAIANDEVYSKEASEKIPILLKAWSQKDAGEARFKFAFRINKGHPIEMGVEEDELV